MLLLRYKQGRQASDVCLLPPPLTHWIYPLHTSSAQLCQGMELFASGTQMNNSQRSLVRVKLCAFPLIDSCVWWHSAACAWVEVTKPLIVRKKAPQLPDVLSRAATQVVMKQPWDWNWRYNSPARVCGSSLGKTCRAGGLGLPPPGHDTNNESIEPDVPRLGAFLTQFL